MKFGLAMTTLRSKPGEGTSVFEKAVMPKPLSTTSRFDSESNAIPRGVVRFENKTREINPGAVETGALNGTPYGWKVEANTALMQLRMMVKGNIDGGIHGISHI